MLDVRAWMLWALAAMTVSVSTRNPLYLILLFLIIMVLDVSNGSVRNRTVPVSPLRFLIFAMLATGVLNGLTAHLGDTVVVRLPAEIPLLGGPVTLEAVVYGATGGMMLGTILAIFVVFNQVTSAHDLIRLMPGAFHEIGVVLSIALMFLPQMTASFERIHEAQAIRGHRLRGVRDWLPILIPLLVSGLERSAALAEAMVARGYGAVSDRTQPLRFQGLLALGMLALLSGWLATLFAPTSRLASVGLMGIGAVLIIVTLWRAGRAVARTEYRIRRWSVRDTVVTLGSVFSVIVVLAPVPLVPHETLDYLPYPALSWPLFDPLAGVGLLGLLAPIAATLRRSTADPRTGDVAVGSRSDVDGSSENAREVREDVETPVVRGLVPCWTAVHNGEAGDKPPHCFGRPVHSSLSQRVDPVIQCDRLAFSYPESSRRALHEATLTIGEGEFVLVAGPSGAGKSTLLRSFNGLVPHFTGGTISGTVMVAGQSAIAGGPETLSRFVGFVFQDPEAQFVVDRVEDEIAFGLENRGLSRAEMQARVATVLEWLNLENLRERPIAALSGGEKQRVAIAAALALHPQVLVFDEPTSQLDPRSAEEMLQIVVRLNRELGLTTVLAEHRLERVLQHGERLVFVPGDASVVHGPTRDLLQQLDLAPPVVALGRAMGWQPLPLTVDEARPFVERSGRWRAANPRAPSTRHPDGRLLKVDGLHFDYGGAPALRDVGLAVDEGAVVALMGENGSGKTTLLRCIVGLLRPRRGAITLAGRSTAGREPAEICRAVGYLPQVPDDLLFADTVVDELKVTLQNHDLLRNPPIAPSVLLDRLGLGNVAGCYSRDLSAGQRQRVALGAVLVTRPRLLLLDEPTRGMDYAAKRDLARLLDEWKAEGMGVVLVTHDVEFAAQCANWVVALEKGAVAASGPPTEVLSRGSFARTQIAQLFPDTGWLTVEDALAGLQRSAPR